MLDAEQLAHYQHNGVLFPLSLFKAEQVREKRDAFLQLEALFGGKPSASFTSQCHLHFPWVYQLVADEHLLDYVQQIIGGDILVHSTTLFHKHADEAGFVSWHQDAYYWGLSEPTLVSVWIALTPSVADNGCLRVIQASHQQGILPHSHRAHDKCNLLRSGLVLDQAPSLERVCDVVLQPGQFSLHHPNIIHGSAKNRLGMPRMGFAIRYVSAKVRQRSEHHSVVVVRGQAGAHYDVVAPPSDTNLTRCAEAQLAFAQRLKQQRQRQQRLDGNASAVSSSGSFTSAIS